MYQSVIPSMITRLTVASDAVTASQRNGSSPRLDKALADIADLRKAVENVTTKEQYNAAAHSMKNLDKRVVTAVAQNRARLCIGTNALSADQALQSAAGDAAASGSSAAACPLCESETPLVACPNAECANGSACVVCYEQWRQAQGGGAVTCMGQVAGRRCGVCIAKPALALAGYTAVQLRAIEREVVERAVAARDGDTVALLLPIAQQANEAAEAVLSCIAAFETLVDDVLPAGDIPPDMQQDVGDCLKSIGWAFSRWVRLDRVLRSRALEEIRRNGDNDSDGEDNMWDDGGPQRTARRMACCPSVGCSGVTPLKIWYLPMVTRGRVGLRPPLRPPDSCGGP